MRNLAEVQRRIVVFLVALGVISAVSLAYLLLPSRTDITAQRQALRDAEQESMRLTQTVKPLHGLPEKLKRADKDIAEFYKGRLASRYSDVVDELGKVASKNKVAIGTVSYKESPTTVSDLQQLEMDADVSAPYPDLARFLNALERDKIFFIINNVTLGGQKGGVVRLNMKFETYLRMKANES